MNFDIPPKKKENNAEDSVRKVAVSLSPISPDTQMFVSGILHRGDSRSVCVMLNDRARSIEIRLPEGEVLSCTGYTGDEAEDIISYLNENIDDILNTARDVNPMKAFMK